MSLDNIKVVVRARPQLENSGKSFWVIDNNSIYHKDDDYVQTGIYSFDKIFDVNEKNADIYNTAVSPMVRSALDGINLTVFAYGATCSGKTYTMNGTSRDPGVIPRIISEVFEQIQTYNNRNFLLRVSYVEIYSEVINDLLDKNNKDLKIREDVYNCINYNPTEKVIKSCKECMSIMKLGTANRTTGETQMNTFSSRSHSIFRIVIESTSTVDPDMPATVSHVNLIDLAGSERVSQTGATGQRFKEGAHINKSLTALGKVIRQLVDKNEYISYRDSKLTRILSNSLGGNAKTIIICNINLESIEDTQSTLMFAQRAKSIKNKPKINEISTDASMAKKLANEVLQLKKLLDAELEKNKRLEEISSGEIYRLHSHIQSLEENFVKTVKKPPKRRHTFCTTLSAITEDKEVAISPQDLNEIAEKSIGLAEETSSSFTHIDLEDDTTDTFEMHEERPCEHTPVKQLKDRLSAIMSSYQNLVDFTRLEKATDDSTEKELERKIDELSKECADLKAYKQYAGAKITKLLEEKQEVFKLCENDHDYAVEVMKTKFQKREQELLNRIVELERSSGRNSLNDMGQEKHIMERVNHHSNNTINNDEMKRKEEIQSKDTITEHLNKVENEEFKLLELQQRVHELELELCDVKNDLFETQDKLVDLTEDLDKEEKKSKKFEEELKKEIEIRTELESIIAQNFAIIKDSEILQDLLWLKSILETKEKLFENVSGLKNDISLEYPAKDVKNISGFDDGRNSIRENLPLSKNSNKSREEIDRNSENTVQGLDKNEILGAIDVYLDEQLSNRNNTSNLERKRNSVNESNVFEEFKNKNEMSASLKSEYESQVSNLKNERDNIMQLNMMIQKEKDDIDRENKDMTARLQTLQDDLEHKINELNNQSEILKRTEKTVQIICNEKESLETKYKSILEKESIKINELTDQVSKLEAQIRELNNDKQIVIESLDEANCLIESLQKQRDTKISMEKNSLVLEYEMLKGEQEKRTEEVKALNEQIAELNLKFCELQKERSTIINSLNEASAEIALLREQNIQLQEEHESEKLRLEQETFEKVSQKKESLEFEYKTMMETEKNKNENMIRELKEQIDILEQQINDLEKENQALKESANNREQQDKLQEKYENLQKETVVLNEKYDQLICSKTESDEMVERLSEILGSIKLQNLSLSQENISLKTKLEDMKRLQDENEERLSKQIRSLKVENTELLQVKVSSGTMTKEMTRLQEENESITGRLREAKKEIERQNIQLKELDENLHASKRTIDKLTEEKGILEQEHKSVLGTLATKNMELTTKTSNKHEQSDMLDNEKPGTDVKLEELINPIREQVMRLRLLFENEASKDCMWLLFKYGRNLNPVIIAKEIKYLADKVKTVIEERNSLKLQMEKNNSASKQVPYISQKYISNPDQNPTEKTQCDVCKKEIEKWKTIATKLQGQQNECKTKLENFSFENSNLSEKLRQMEIKNRQLQQHIGNKENKPKASLTTDRDGRLSPGLQNHTSPESNQNKKGDKWKQMRSRDHDSRRSIDLNTICSDTVESCANCGRTELELHRLNSELSILKKRLETLECANDGLKKLCRIRNEEISRLKKQHQ